MHKVGAEGPVLFLFLHYELVYDDWECTEWVIECFLLFIFHYVNESMLFTFYFHSVNESMPFDFHSVNESMH